MAAGLSQTEFGSVVDVSGTAISYAEMGKGGMKLKYLLPLLDHFGYELRIVAAGQLDRSSVSDSGEGDIAYIMSETTADAQKKIADKKIELESAMQTMKNMGLIDESREQYSLGLCAGLDAAADALTK